ncbi:hypothetical protein O3M35_008776 [Rhynocoris fuscipes]|uniref:Uncharacterized protein n=1 Tax=Rhynocoris fuscipes TaxID=488301 RepID=A0AAW1DCQ0_9HEMI
MYSRQCRVTVDDCSRMRREREIARGQLPHSMNRPQPPPMSSQKDFPSIPQSGRPYSQHQTQQNPLRIQQNHHYQQQQQQPHQSTQQQQQPQPPQNINRSSIRGPLFSQVVRQNHSFPPPLSTLPPTAQPDLTTLLNSFFQRFESLLTPLINLLNTLITQLLPRLAP